MKAVICERFGGPENLSVREISVPNEEPGHVLVRVLGAGMNFADLLVLRGQYQIKVEPPFVPGAEIYGVIESLGHGVRDFAVGDHVMGQVISGGYAQFALLDIRQAVKLTTPMLDADAAAFFINYGTAYTAMVQRARARAGETLLVLGASGGVGLAAVQIGRAMGMRVIADVRGPAKKELLTRQGAELLIEHADVAARDQVLDFTGGRGCDIVLDMIGADASRLGLRCLAWCGRFVVVGFAGGSPHAFPGNHLLVKNAEIIGHWWGDFHWRDRVQLDQAFHALFSLYAQGRLRPHVQDIFQLEDVATALRHFERRSVLGKLIVLPNTLSSDHDKERNP